MDKTIKALGIENSPAKRPPLTPGHPDQVEVTAFLQHGMPVLIE